MSDIYFCRRRVLAGLIMGATCLGAPARLMARPFESLFAPKARLWRKREAFDPGSRARVDHGDWDRFLRKYLVHAADGINRVAYGRVAASDSIGLRRYIEALAATPISHYNRPQQFAYWVNLYNALTVAVVLAHYPVKSIRNIDISPGLFSTGPWDRKLLAVEGEPLTLNDIEHRILRPIWRDPRVHYAVNCASLGCPNLQATAFTVDRLDERLDAAGRAYVNHPRGSRIEDGALIVSSLYGWYEEDFGGSQAGVIAHLRRYAHSPWAAALAKIGGIDGYEYDWRLNDADAPPPSQG